MSTDQPVFILMSAVLNTPSDKYQQWFDSVLTAFVKFDEEVAGERRATEVKPSAASSESTVPLHESREGSKGATPPPTVAGEAVEGDPSEASNPPPRQSTDATTSRPSTPMPSATESSCTNTTIQSASTIDVIYTRRVSDDGEAGAISSIRTPAVSSLPSCKIAQKYLRELVDASQSAKTAERLCALVKPLEVAFTERPLTVCTEPLLVMLFATFVSNLAAHTTASAELIDGTTLVDLLLVLGQHHRRIKKVIIAIFSAISNLMHVDNISLPGDVAELMTILIAPLYSEASVVEVWAGAVANIVIRCPDTWPTFIEAGTTSTIQRLLVYFGDDPRILRSGLHCLTALSFPTIVPRIAAVGPQHPAPPQN